MSDIRDMRTLTLAGALKVLNAAIDAADVMAQPMCIAVVDAGGNLLAFGRMEGSKGLSVTSSINKARTAALSGEPTGGANADVELQVALAHESRWTNLIGGLPIRVAGFTIGAIAAGSGTGTQDLAVARSGASAVAGADMFESFVPRGAEDTGFFRPMQTHRDPNDHPCCRNSGAGQARSSALACDSVESRHSGIGQFAPASPNQAPCSHRGITGSISADRLSLGSVA